jgi:hypothetical protein
MLAVATGAVAFGAPVFVMAESAQAAQRKANQIVIASI